MLIHQSKANFHEKLFFGQITPWVAVNDVIVKNVNANIPVSLSWLLRPFLAFLCFPGSAQFIASIRSGLIQFLCKSEAALVRSGLIQFLCKSEAALVRFCREIELGHYELEAMNWAEPGKQRKAMKGGRSHDKDTGMFAFTFLTITSFPATHDHTSLRPNN